MSEGRTVPSVTPVKGGKEKTGVESCLDQLNETGGKKGKKRSIRKYNSRVEKELEREKKNE